MIYYRIKTSYKEFVSKNKKIINHFCNRIEILELDLIRIENIKDKYSPCNDCYPDTFYKNI